MNRQAMHPDNVIPLTVIWFLGIGFVGGFIGMYLLAFYGIKPPEGSSNIVSAMGGALGAVLVNTKTSRSPGSLTREGDTVPVEVMNEPDAAVPVETRPGEAKRE